VNVGRGTRCPSPLITPSGIQEQIPEKEPGGQVSLKRFTRVKD
jgi:hypothetical protein